MLAAGRCDAMEAGLREFTADDFAFDYPDGWERDEGASPGKNNARRPKGPVAAFQDPFEPEANVSVVVSGLPKGDYQISVLGEPREVAEKLVATVVAPKGSGRRAELRRCGIVERAGVEYLQIELLVRGPGWARHSFTSLAMRPERLYSFTLQLPAGGSYGHVDRAAVLNSFRVF